MRAPGQKPKEFFGWHKPFLFFISLLCTQFGDQSFLTGLTSCCLSCPAVVLCYLSLCFCLTGLSACLVVMPVVQSFIRIRWPEPTDCISQASTAHRLSYSYQEPAKASAASSNRRWELRSSAVVSASEDLEVYLSDTSGLDLPCGVELRNCS